MNSANISSLFLFVTLKAVLGIKRAVIPIVMILCGMSAGILIASVIYAFTGFAFLGSVQRQAVAAEDPDNAEITMLAYTVLNYIRDDDFTSLSRVVHPVFGVVFSPYATINLSTNQRFGAEEVAMFNTDSHVYMWGVYNGSGEPITLTPPEYFEKFVPAADHINAPVVGINRIVRTGNALENMTDVFPNVKFVEFHIPGSESVDELDWSSLRLGFEEYDGQLRLIAIIYNTWTV